MPVQSRGTDFGYMIFLGKEFRVAEATPAK